MFDYLKIQVCRTHWKKVKGIRTVTLAITLFELLPIIFYIETFVWKISSQVPKNYLKIGI